VGESQLRDASDSDGRRVDRGLADADVARTARARYFDVHPDRDSRLTLDAASRNRWGDPLGDPPSGGRGDASAGRERASISDSVRAAREENDGRIGNVSALNIRTTRAAVPHSADPAERRGQPRPDARSREPVRRGLTDAADGCTNGTLTFVALALRSVDEIERAKRRGGFSPAGPLRGGLKPAASIRERQNRATPPDRTGSPSCRRRSTRRARASARGRDRS
jgi:hypothetical protein